MQLSRGRAVCAQPGRIGLDERLPASAFAAMGLILAGLVAPLLRLRR